MLLFCDTRRVGYALTPISRAIPPPPPAQPTYSWEPRGELAPDPLPDKSGPKNDLFRSDFCLVDGGTLQPDCCKLITSSDQQFLMRPHGLPPFSQ